MSKWMLFIVKLHVLPYYNYKANTNLLKFYADANTVFTLHKLPSWFETVILAQ